MLALQIYPMNKCRGTSGDLVVTDPSLGSDLRSTYEVDFDEFFVQHLLDEVVAREEGTGSLPREENEGV